MYSDMDIKVAFESFNCLVTHSTCTSILELLLIRDHIFYPLKHIGYASSESSKKPLISAASMSCIAIPPFVEMGVFARDFTKPSCAPG